MSVKSCEKLDKSKVALTIEADAAAFEAAINKAYLQQRSKISVPGFRPGKAPRKMIESMYGAEVFYEEAVNILLPDAYEAAVKEQELKVVGYPEVELESCGKDGVVFKCTVAVYPEVTLGQYKGLEAPKAEVNVTDEDVDNRLNEMADRNSRLVSVEREIQKGELRPGDRLRQLRPRLRGSAGGHEGRRGEGHRHHLPRELHPRAGRQARGVPREGQRGQAQGSPRH